MESRQTDCGEAKTRKRNKVDLHARLFGSRHGSARML